MECLCLHVCDARAPVPVRSCWSDWVCVCVCVAAASHTHFTDDARLYARQFQLSSAVGPLLCVIISTISSQSLVIFS